MTEQENRQILRISKEQLAIIGSGSIQGMAFAAGFSRGPITIVFKGSSLSYCQQNSGPELVIIPDFVPACIVESVLSMQKSGWDVVVELDIS